MGARKAAGLSRDLAYEGAGLAAPLVYNGVLPSTMVYFVSD